MRTELREKGEKKMKLKAALSAACLLLNVPGLAAREAESTLAPQTSRSASFATYAERVDRVEVVVGSLSAAVAANEKYVPLQIAVGVWGRGAELEITPERFLLIDSKGNMLTPAPVEEIAKQASVLQFAKSFDKENRLRTGDDFSLSRPVASNFYPLEGGKFYSVTYLDRETYLEDLLFFAQPEAGLDGLLTLQLLVPGMDKAVEVKFEVPLNHRRTKEHQKKHKQTLQASSSGS